MDPVHSTNFSHLDYSLGRVLVGAVRQDSGVEVGQELYLKPLQSRWLADCLIGQSRYL